MIWYIEINRKFIQFDFVFFRSIFLNKKKKIIIFNDNLSEKYEEKNDKNIMAISVAIGEQKLSSFYLVIL